MMQCDKCWYKTVCKFKDLYQSMSTDIMDAFNDITRGDGQFFLYPLEIKCKFFQKDAINCSAIRERNASTNLSEVTKL